jgi:hypothetical protein
VSDCLKFYKAAAGNQSHQALEREGGQGCGSRPPSVSAPEGGADIEELVLAAAVRQTVLETKERPEGRVVGRSLGS